MRKNDIFVHGDDCLRALTPAMKNDMIPLTDLEKRAAEEFGGRIFRIGRVM